jgi:hypothetical protein
MAWWTTQLIFRGNQLIAEGFDPVPMDDLELVLDDPVPGNGFERYTRVIVSGYALYGQLRGYYALGVSHWHLDQTANRAFMSEDSQRHTEPVSSLTPAQRAIVRECLINLNPMAWETSTLPFRRALEA